MKFLSRSLIGIFILALTLGLLFLAGGQIFWAIQETQGEENRRRPAQERVFAADVATLSAVSVVPTITSYGTVQSARVLEIRTSVAGEIVTLSPNLRDGGLIAAGDALFSIDPTNLQSALALVKNELAEQEAELVDAGTALEISREEQEVGLQQHALRVQSLQRQQDLKSRGVASDADIETAALALSTSEQSLLNMRQAVAQNETRVVRAEIALQRNAISLADAERALANANVAAPFSGVISDVSAGLGTVVSNNEQLATLMDLDALEVAFRISNAQFARLLDADGRLQDLSVQATLDLDDLPFTINGTVERAGAVVGDGQTGRLLYATLDGNGASVLRPGDFLTVEIKEAPLENVAVIPAAAVSSKGGLLVLGDEDRLEEVVVDILRRQTDTIIVASAPYGREYVTARSQQIGVGIKVNPLRQGDATAEPDEPQTVVLDDERRAKLIAFIEGNERMPADVKDRILTQLQLPEVPKDVVERLESRMGG